MVITWTNNLRKSVCVCMLMYAYMGLPGTSAGKESACNAKDSRSVPGSGRSPGEGIGYPLQYSWASLVAQLVKNLPAMRETWVRSLGWEDPLENPHGQRSLADLPFMGSQRAGHDWATKQTRACEGSESESRSVVSDSLWPHGLFPRPEYWSG